MSASISSVPPSAPELALLQHAQQLHLHDRAHLADLVEEDRALLGDLDQPLLVAVGAGERAAHVAEQLGVEQRLGQRAAVDAPRTAARGAAS